MYINCPKCNVSKSINIKETPYIFNFDCCENASFNVYKNGNYYDLILIFHSLLNDEKNEERYYVNYKSIQYYDFSNVEKCIVLDNNLPENASIDDLIKILNKFIDNMVFV